MAPDGRLGDSDRQSVAGGRGTVPRRRARGSRRRMGRPDGAVLHLCAEFPRPFPPGDIGQAHRGHVAHLGRPDRSDRRSLFCDLLLLPRDPRRLDRRQDEPRLGPHRRLRDLERRDDGLRHRGELRAARRSAHDRGIRRSGRCAAVLRDHLGLLPVRPARHRARHLQSRAAHRRRIGDRLPARVTCRASAWPCAGVRPASAACARLRAAPAPRPADIDSAPNARSRRTRRRHAG